MICGFFKGNEVSPESNISIDTWHIVQQICVAWRSFVSILSIFIHEFLEYTFKIKVGRGKKKRKKRDILRPTKTLNIPKAVYSILVLKRIRYATESRVWGVLSQTKVIPLPDQSQCANKFKRANRISQWIHVADYKRGKTQVIWWHWV